MFGIFWNLKEQTTIAHFWLNEAPQLSQTSLILSLLSKIPNSEFLKCQNIRMQLCEVLLLTGRGVEGFKLRSQKCSCLLSWQDFVHQCFYISSRASKESGKDADRKGCSKVENFFLKIPLWLRQLHSWFHHQKKALTHKIIPAICRITGIVQFQKISNLLIPRRVIGISQPKFLKQTINQNWNNFPERWRGGGVGDNICQRSIGF